MQRTLTLAACKQLCASTGSCGSFQYAPGSRCLLSLHEGRANLLTKKGNKLFNHYEKVGKSFIKRFVTSRPSAK
jgi:hypothetical protein